MEALLGEEVNKGLTVSPSELYKQCRGVVRQQLGPHEERKCAELGLNISLNK